MTSASVIPAGGRSGVAGFSERSGRGGAARTGIDEGTGEEAGTGARGNGPDIVSTGVDLPLDDPGAIGFGRAPWDGANGWACDGAAGTPAAVRVPAGAGTGVDADAGPDSDDEA